MNTPRFQLTVRAVVAAAIALAGSFYAVPALAEGGGPETVPTASADASPSATASPAPADATTSAGATAPAAPATAPEISDAGLAEAVRRDLGMTLEEFNAAGQLARTAADAVPSLSGLPGYLGISLRDGKIHVEGSGAELEARVNELNAGGTTAVFLLVAPVPNPPAEPADAPATQPPAAPAAVPSAADLVASSTEQLFQAYVRDVGPAALQAVAYSGGRFIIRTGGKNVAEATLPAVLDPQVAPATTDAAPGKISPADFVARYANVQLEQGPPVTTEADVYGGEGYIIDRQTICSTGFGAFNEAGLPVVLTAGHCAEDGTARSAELEPPTSATAGGSAPLPGTLAPLGSFGFSQFGGLQNAWVQNPLWNTGDPGDPGNVGTDIAVIETLDGGINVQPAATTWASAANPGPTAVKIVGVVAPSAGQAVCRSGRTDGWSCGQVKETGIYVVGGRTTAAGDLRAFRGFLSNDVQSSGGDSGGPWISGNYAVGTHSAGEARPKPGEPPSPNFAIATTLQDALTKFPTAVQLQLFLNKPVLVAPQNGASVAAGDPIQGRVPSPADSPRAADSKVRISIAGHQPLEVPVDAVGDWSFVAPFPAGRLSFSAETVNGFSRSGAVNFTVDVAPSALQVPEITTDPGAALPALTSIDGTGMSGANVTLSGDLTGTGTVGLDGHWTVPLAGQAAVGKVTVTATLSSPGIADSPSTTQTFTVIPPTPAETTIPDGTRFSQDALPETISGTGVDGADVAVLIDGLSVGATQAGAGGAGVGARAVVRSMVPQVLVAGGRWSVPFPAGLTPGSHTLSVTQSVDGVASAPRLVTFTIEAPAVAPPAAPAEPGVPAAAAPVLPAGTGQLPNTGAGSLLPTAGLAGGAILLGSVLLGGTKLAAARRRAVR